MTQRGNQTQRKSGMWFNVALDIFVIIHIKLFETRFWWKSLNYKEIVISVLYAPQILWSLVRNASGVQLLTFGRSLIDNQFEFSYPCVFLRISKIGYSLNMCSSKFYSFLPIFSTSFWTFFACVLWLRVVATVMLKISLIYTLSK